MAKDFNPVKYIKERARKLPFYKCYVNDGWEDAGIVQVVVSRQHTNGNITAGIYMVDLLCLGVKDTFFITNEDAEVLDNFIEKFLESGLNPIEIDYNLAHNIIYAGYEFALDSGLDAHKDFEKVTKYILEIDDERVPLIPIEVGTEGKPHYVKSPFDTGTFAAKVVRTLEENLGEGNFIYSEYNDEDDEFEYDDEFDEDFEDEFGDRERIAEKIEFLEKLLKTRKEEFEDKDGNLIIEKVKESCLELMEEGIAEEIESDLEKAEKHFERLKILSSLLMTHYSDSDRIEDLIEKWSSDEEVMPYFEFEEEMDEEDEDEIFDAIYGDDFGLREINLIKTTFKNPALADFIILARKEEINWEESDDEIEKTTKKNEKMISEFKEKYPDFPLVVLLSSPTDMDIENLTALKIFGEDYEISNYEFERYLLLKQKLLSFQGDLNGLMALDKAKFTYNIDRDISYELEAFAEGITQMLAINEVLKEQMGEEED